MNAVQCFAHSMRKKNDSRDWKRFRKTVNGYIFKIKTVYMDGKHKLKNKAKK
jgi:hypothetical protein